MRDGPKEPPADSSSVQGDPCPHNPVTRGLPLGGATAFDPHGITSVVRSQYIEAIKMNEAASTGDVEDWLKDGEE